MAPVEVLSALPVQGSTTLFSLDVDGIRKILKSFTWVQSAHISCKFPNKVHISIVEHKPYMLWQHQNKVFVVTASGCIIPNASHKHFTHLPLVLGNGANTKAHTLLNSLREHAYLSDRIKSAQFIKNRRWRLYFDGGIIVDLPENNFDSALNKLSLLCSTEKIMDRSINIIDTRVKNKVIFTLMKEVKKSKGRSRGGV